MSEKILVVGPSWVGDIVMAQSLFISLKQRDPDCVIDVLAPGWSLPLEARMPEVRRGIEFPAGHGEVRLGELWSLGRRLRAEQYDRAIVLPRKLKAALVPFFAGIPRRTGYRGDSRYWLINDARPLDETLLKRTVEQHVALGGATPATTVPVIPEPRLRVDEANRARLLASMGLSLVKPVVGMMPGAEYGPSKQWPVEYYAELAVSLGREGRQVWVFGSAKERVHGEVIEAAAPGTVINLCGRTQLVDAVDLLSLCREAVTNDSGLMHVAAAVGVPLIALYGATPPQVNPPLTKSADILFLDLSCSPCWQRTCPLGHHNCLRQITAPQVLERLHGLGH
jgi:heptosyltransferase II